MGDDLFFTNGDCTVHRQCLREHRERSGPLAIIAGQRVQVGKELTEQRLLKRTMLNGLTSNVQGFSRAPVSSRAGAFVIRNGLLRSLLRKDNIKPATSVIGCNCSHPKQPFMDINGYDGDFLGFGDEDADLGIRVLNPGGSIRSVRNLAIVCHHCHPGSWDMTTDHFKHNAAIKNRRIANKEAYCLNGITKRS